MAMLGVLMFIVFVCENSNAKSYNNTKTSNKSNNDGCLMIIEGKNSILMCSGMKLREVCEIVGENFTKVWAKVNDTKLTKDDFIGCESVQEMSLSNSSLIYLEKDALLNLTVLSLMDLGHNKLDIYREESVYELDLPHSLHTLKLNGNIGLKANIEHLKYPIFNQAIGIRTLFIDGLPNKDLKVFKDKVNSLENLTMTSKSGYCNIPYVKETTFREVRDSLKHLNISDCNITKFEFAALKDFKELELLDLSYNRGLGFVALENISYGLQFTKIKVLNYSYVHKPFGKSLTVRKRDICYLYNTSIKEFTMEGNRIDLFESNSFILLPSLKTFRIGNNRLTIGIYIFQLGCINNLTDLHSGYLDTFGLVKQPDFARNLDEYISKQDDDCPDNYATECPFMTESYLKHIAERSEFCSFYNGHTIPSTYIMHIKNIYAPQCGFVSALNSIIILDFINLEKLDLSRNRIYNIPTLYVPVERLKYLDLSENRCGSLDIDTGKHVPNLEQLYLQNNLIGLSLKDRQFINFPNLKVLNMSDNSIHTLPKNVFLNMTNLEILDLSRNTIQKWTADIESLKSLIHLNLRFNFIDSLPSSVLEHFDNMEQHFSIDLRNNTIQCSCSSKDFLHWIVKHKNNMIGYNDYLFYDKERKLTTQEFEHKVYTLDGFCQSYTEFILVPSVFITIFFIVVFGGIVYKNRWQIRYFIYMTKRKYFSYDILPDDETENVYKYEAFISYAEDNADFVSEQLVPKLEQYGLSLCVHQRDFIAGRSIIDNIINAVQSSRITIAILSREFVKSRWCMYEFQMARMESVYTRDDKGCLLIVMKDTIPIGEMPLEMISWLKYESYLEHTKDDAGAQLFWERLKETLNVP